MRLRRKVLFLAALLILFSAFLLSFLPLRTGSAEPGSLRLYSVSTVVTKGTEVTQHWQSHASNDSYYQIDTEGVTWYSIDVEMIFSTTVDPTTLSNITVFSEAHVADPLNPVDINIYDYVNLLWVPCFNVSASTDANHTKTFATNLTNYISVTAAEMRLQVYYRVKAVQSIYQDHTYIELTPKGAAPVASFTYSPSKPTVNENVTFNASASYDPDGTIVSWDWNFGDGYTGSGEVVVHAYAAAGDYNVALTVTDNDTLTDTDWQLVTVYLHDVAVISVTTSATEVLVGETVTVDVVVENQGTATENFTVTTYYNVTVMGTPQDVTDLLPGANTTLSWLWDTTGVALGNYTISAEASVVSGETETTDNTLVDGIVTVKKGPVASFTIWQAPPYFVGDTLTFDASSSTPDGGELIDPDGYAWDFETDGIIDIYGMIVNHTYTAPGTYNVTLTVTDTEGLSDTSTASVTVKKYPVASFTYSPEAPAVNEDVTFDASSSTPDGGELIDPDGYFWDFGDGTNTTGMIVVHAFAAEGTYNVTLTVTDTEGLSDSHWELVDVYLHDIAITSVTAAPTEVVVGDSVTIDVGVLNEGTAAETFNVSVFYDSVLIETKTSIYLDASASTAVSFTWTTAVNGTFTISAEVPPVPGETDLSDNTFIDGVVTVKKGPVASFTISPDPPHYVGDTLTFDASASTPDGGELIDPDSYFWDFGDGTNAYGMIVNHTYTSVGTFTVILNVTDTEGLSNTATTDVTILGYPVASFTISPDPPHYVGDTLTFDASASTPDGGVLTDPDSYAWDFETDGVIDAYGKIVNYAYVSAGDYNVTLTVTDSDGLSNSTWQLVTINDVHDVAVVDVTPAATEAYPTWTTPLEINVTVVNEGTATETFNVTAYYNITATDWVAIDTIIVTDLAPGASTTLTFNWGLSGIDPPLVTSIKANATIVSGEIDTVDNTFTYPGTVYVKVPGDVNGDGTVNVSDLGLLGLAWGSSFGDPDYDPRCDFNGDGVINVSDLGIMGLWWGYIAG